MKATEIMNELFALSDRGDYSNTCDTLKAGDPDVEVKKVAVTMHATVEIIRRAAEWGAQLIIVHEPTYYNHPDKHSDERIECEKRRLLEQTGITVFRFHDHPHFAVPDIIGAGQLKSLGLKGELEVTEQFGLTRLHLEKPISTVGLAKLLETRCGLKHVRICGERDHEFSVISGMFGTPGRVKEEIARDGDRLVLTGEICEWALGEYVRDCAALGYNKALIVMGHEGSEREGMRYTAEILSEKHPELQVQYMECGEVYTYTDS